MVIVVTRSDSKIVVSLNSETLICNYTEDVFKALLKLAEEDLQQCTSMADAVLVADRVRGMVAEQGNLAEVNFVETACKDHLVHDPIRGTYHLKTKDGKVVSTIPLPKSLVERILTSVEKGIDPTPVVKAIIRFFRNPNLSIPKLKNFIAYLDYNMVDEELKNKLIAEGFDKKVALGMASFKQTPITTEGLICTYKVSREVTNKWALVNGEKVLVPRYDKTIDELTGEISTSLPEFVEDRIFEPAVMRRSGDAFTTLFPSGRAVKDHLYIVGNIHFLDNWGQVNLVDGTFGGGGLHFGNLVYIHGYEGADTATHNCFIDPADIGGFSDSGDGAVRCLRGAIHSSKAGDNRGIYFSSSFAKKYDDEWEAMKVEAIKNAAAKLEEISSESKTRLDFLGLI